MVSPIGARGTADANKLACAVVCAGAVYCALNRRRLLRQINRYAPTQPDALHVHPNAPHRHTHTYAQIFSHTPAHTSGAEQMESGGGRYTSCLKTNTRTPRTHTCTSQARTHMHAHMCGAISHAEGGRLAPHLFDQLRKLCHRHFHQIFSCSAPAPRPRRRPRSPRRGIVSGSHLIFGASASSPVPRSPSCPRTPAHACSRLALEKGGTRHAVLGRARPDKFRNLAPSARSARKIGAWSVPCRPLHACFSCAPLMCANGLLFALYRTVLRMGQGEGGRQQSRQRGRQRSGRGTGMGGHVK
jgi:hypothetical protein